MFIERKLNPATLTVELWRCEWENVPGKEAKKIFIEKVSDEHPAQELTAEDLQQMPAICWAYGRTLGNIAVFSQSILGSFPKKSGSDAILPCEFVDAGKFRHGAPRQWCRTHQAHWGTKADIESFVVYREMTCANRDQKMNYVVGPFQLDLNEFAEVGVWCSMPPALVSSGLSIKPRPPKIHVHVRKDVGEDKHIDQDFQAISISYNSELGLFEDSNISLVNITPPAAFEFVKGLEFDLEMDCVSCSACGYPHLDLGDFAKKPHKKHFCANCGRDSTWSKEPIVSTPLKPLHDAYPKAGDFIVPDRTLNLDNYEGHNFVVWASTPAVIWTGNRPQEKGIHVHVHDGTSRVVDDTFAEVTYKGEKLERTELINVMMDNTVV